MPLRVLLRTCDDNVRPVYVHYFQGQSRPVYYPYVTGQRDAVERAIPNVCQILGVLSMSVFLDSTDGVLSVAISHRTRQGGIIGPVYHVGVLPSTYNFRVLTSCVTC